MRMKLFEHILSVKFPSFEHVGSPFVTGKFPDKSTVTADGPGRNVSVPGSDESWIDGLSAADDVRQYGMDPNVILTPDGKLENLMVKNMFLYLRMAQIIHLA